MKRRKNAKRVASAIHRKAKTAFLCGKRGFCIVEVMADALFIRFRRIGHLDR